MIGKYITTMAQMPQPLFKPLACIWYAGMRSVFDVNYYWDRVLGFLLHLGVAYIMLRLFRNIADNVFAYILALFFSILITNFDCVVSSPTIYLLLMCSLVVGSLQILYNIEKGQSLSTISSVILILFISLASFFNESGFLFGLLFSGLFYFIAKARGNSCLEKRKNTLVIALPSLLCVGGFVAYQLLFKRSCFNITGEAESFVSVNNIFGGIISMVQMFLWAPIYSLTPAATRIILRDMIHFNLDDVFTLPWIKIANILIASGIIFIYIRHFISMRQFNKSKKFIIFSILFLIAYFLPIAVGRAATSGYFYLATQSRYLYIVNLFYIFIIYLLIDFHKLRNITNRTLGTFMILLAMLICLHVNRVFISNKELVRSQGELKVYFDQVSRFVAQHKNEKDFSFIVLGHPLLSLPPKQQIIDHTHFPFGVSSWGSRKCIVGPFSRYIAPSIMQAKYVLDYKNGAMMNYLNANGEIRNK